MSYLETAVTMVLDDAHAELARGPDHWTQTVFRRDKFGKSVPLGDPAVTCRCLLGQLIDSSHRLRACGKIKFSNPVDVHRFEVLVSKTVVGAILETGCLAVGTALEPSVDLVWFNDRSTYQQVIHVLATACRNAHATAALASQNQSR